MMAEVMKGREGMRPGQDLIVAGYIGLGGTAIAAARREQMLLEHFTPQFVERCQNILLQNQLPPLEIFREAGAAEMELSGEGGIMVTLWRLFKEYGLGFEIKLRELPVLQETIEVCEVFDLNPYRLESSGCILLAADHGGDMVYSLHNKGIYGTVIGKVEAGIKCKIRNGEICSFLDRPKPDELYKI